MDRHRAQAALQRALEDREQEVGVVHAEAPEFAGHKVVRVELDPRDLVLVDQLVDSFESTWLMGRDAAV